MNESVEAMQATEMLVGLSIQEEGIQDTELFGQLDSNWAEYTIDHLYLETVQTDIRWSMRLLLFDWMMEVCDEYTLKRETYHLTTSLVDLYLSKKKCPVSKLQLLGATCLLIGSKMEEIVCPRAKDFAFATDSGFTKD